MRGRGRQRDNNELCTNPADNYQSPMLTFTNRIISKFFTSLFILICHRYLADMLIPLAFSDLKVFAVSFCPQYCFKGSTGLLIKKILPCSFHQISMCLRQYGNQCLTGYPDWGLKNKTVLTIGWCALPCHVSSLPCQGY